MSYGVEKISGSRRAQANDIRGQLRHRALRGTFQIIPDPVVTEILAAAGADFALVDGEHGAIGIERLESLVRAGDARGLPILYRAASASDDISKALDTGIAGIVVPRVESAQEARQVVQAVRAPPLGARGIGPGRAALFGLDMASLRQRADDELLLCLMIETRAGLEALDAILAVEGVDAIMIGPADLASSLGVAAGSAELSAAMETIRNRALATGKICGIHCRDAQDAASREADGFHMLAIGLDTAFLTEAAMRNFTEQR